MIKIANAQGFWGDSSLAPARLLKQEPDLDYLTLEYLAEVSLSIMAIQKEHNPDMGYARQFLDLLGTLTNCWERGAKFKVITNAGGLNPQGCAYECIDFLENNLSRPIKVGIVYGDDVLSQMDNSSNFHNLETGEKYSVIQERLVTANAYLGSEGIVKALQEGADIVITGRITDPSLTVAPCMAHFGWSRTDYDRLAKATVAGHLIECGTQVTGGISTDWLSVPHPENIGFPIIEIDEEGEFVVTKPPKTGGLVDEMTVKEQLVYEIGDPEQYLSPDVTVDLSEVKVQQEGPDRVRVTGARGKAPTNSYKVSATYRDGYKAEGMLLVFGSMAQEKVRKAGQMLLDRLALEGTTFQETLVECLGMGDAVPGVVEPGCPGIECLLRVAVRDADETHIEKFARELASLVTSGPPGTTGYTTGKPTIRSVFGYWPCLIPKDLINVEHNVWEVAP